MSEGHARLGPSNHRWPHCAGSIREEERYPDIAGEAAIDGTGSHLLLEMCLINNVPAIQYDQQIIGVNHRDNPAGWLVDLARIGRVQMCLDYVTRRVGELQQQFPGCMVTVEAEQKVNPGGSFLRKDWWGTCDITIIAYTGDIIHFVESVDYKDGRGWVHVPGNTQLIGYLFGKLREYVGSGPDLCRPWHPEKVTGCRMTIVQPKTNPVIRYQCSDRADDKFSVHQVIAEADKLGTAAGKTDAPNAPLTPGKWCQWCKANPKRGGHCTAEAEKSLKVVESMSDTELITTDGGNKQLFEIISQAVADPKSLTVDQLSELADAEAGLMAAFGKVKDEIELRIEQGDRVPGYAMQPGNDSNIWCMDEEAIVKMLKARRLKKDVIYPAKLISPAQVLKLKDLNDDQKKKIERDYITKKAGKMGLRKVSRDHQANVEKDVTQSSTEVLDSAELMFAGAPKTEPTPLMFAEQRAAEQNESNNPETNEVSFF